MRRTSRRACPNTGAFGSTHSRGLAWLLRLVCDTAALLWDMRASDPAVQPVVLKGHPGPIDTVAVTSDSRWVITRNDVGFTGVFDFSVRLWLLRIEDLLALARRTAGRNLSTNEWNTFLPGQPYFEVFPGLPIPKD